jgi:hypothetical protein
VRQPVRGGPFPTLNVSWDPKQVNITAGEVGRLLLAGEPRIMTHAEGESHSFLIRPVALKPGEHKIVAQRLADVFSRAPRGGVEKPKLASPSVNLAGVWEVDIHYEVGSSRHKLFLNVNGNQVTGAHDGWVYRGDVTGEIDGDRVHLHSTLPAEAQKLSYTFSGTASGDAMSGTLALGEYGQARWSARRHSVA